MTVTLIKYSRAVMYQTGTLMKHSRTVKGDHAKSAIKTKRVFVDSLYMSDPRRPIASGNGIDH
jgi:hypothetical protein